ncbi:hypothetical protein FEM48_Zijuj08G0161000 [Ziziphus jujuba var. spinosa]|uniref:Large ribosomal subunit protein uL29c n=1 Tax=Ziziphus jujuba var. spinosa TaxID=714518 RepID=A0A978V022_ZIZJJ|nr:hypothetical protein FEM48_Zijuj08G0161000 [Ziziphus jujuba var. spinosa]
MLSPISIASPSTATLPPKLLSSLPNSSFNGLRLQLSFPIRVPPSAASFGKPSPSSSVVMMAKRDEEMKEIRAKTTEEINEEVIDLKGELLMLRLEKSVARLLTVRREREIEEGINKRLSRKFDRQWKKSIVVRPPPSLKKLLAEEAAAKASEATVEVEKSA